MLCASDFDQGVRSRWRGGLSAVACSFNRPRAGRHTHVRTLEERAVRGQSHEGIESPSGLLFRERRSVQQGGEERMEIAGTGELKLEATIPKPRFSPKMKHDSCHSQYSKCTNGNKCPVHAPVSVSDRHSASQAVSMSTGNKLHLTSFPFVGKIQAYRASHT